MPYLGLDIGTGGCKALLIDDAGTVLAHRAQGLSLQTPEPLFAEQHPGDWWTATCQSVRAVVSESGIDPAAIHCVGITGQMHGLVVLDEDDTVIRPAILWNDQRTHEECDTIESAIGRDRMIELTGKPVLTGFTLPKIAWMKIHEPALWLRVRSILLPKDFIRFKLTGVKAIDVSDASGTSVLDLSTRRWSRELLDRLDIDEALLPPVVESLTMMGAVTHEAAESSGLTVGTPVIAGAGDQAAEAIGSGITSEGSVSVAVGTSGVVFAPSSLPPCDPTGRLHGYCHAIPEMWHVMAVMLSAGGSLSWFTETMGSALGDDPWESMYRRASEIDPGCEGVTFLPYLTGERTPHADPLATASWTGITRRHDIGHLGRAVIEGVCFGLRECLDLVRASGLSVDRVRVSGGVTAHATFRSMLADVLDATVVTTNSVHGAAFGAAVLAMAGHTVTPPHQVAAEIVKETSETPPTDPGAYDDPLKRYQSIYPALAAISR